MIPPNKLARLVDRFHALEAELAPVAAAIEAYRGTARELEEAEALIADPSSDAEMRSLAEQERAALKERLAAQEHDLKIPLLPKDAADSSSAIVEIRAGTGGDEAALFAAELLRMYQRYAQLQGWRTELMSLTESDLGGVKDAVLEVVGQGRVLD